MPRPVAKDHDAKRAALLKSAARVFAREGYDRAAMSGVAGEAGISKALIYHYYDSKDALLFDILQSHLSGLLMTVQTVSRQGSSENYLRHLVHALLDAYRGVDDEHVLQLEAMRGLSGPQQQALADIQREIVAVFAEAIRAARPELFDSVDLRAVTMSLFGMLNWFYLWHQPTRGISRADYADLATDLMLGGLSRVGERSAG